MIHASLMPAFLRSRPPRARGLKHLKTGLDCKQKLSRPPRARGLKLSRCLTCPAGRASRPPRARGLKLHLLCDACLSLGVAPPAGAWIETYIKAAMSDAFAGRAPRGRVD